MPQFPFGFGNPCLPTRVTVAPAGPTWLHEIKHDGYRLMVRRSPSGVRIKTRRGNETAAPKIPGIRRAWSAAL